MVPKKLTDCPENLRESIDWLIQIRNGGDKTGLQNLAKALDKLINKAIEDAENSLKAEEEKLKCPIIYEGNLSYCQVNDRSLDEAQKKLEELKAKGDPESQSQRKQLEDEIEQLKQYKQKCIDDTHPRYPESQALKGIRAKLKASQELSKTLSPFLKHLQKTAQNHGDSILHNLCTGLEDFLGFDPSSKGYTGKGIVYSDLDRLCDGVMAFLHGMLESVKRDDAVRTYDDDMSDMKLTTVIESLNSKVGTGCAGLLESATQMKTWCEKYNQEVCIRTGKFISEIIGYKTSTFKLYNNIDGLKSKNLIDVSEYFREHLDHFGKAVSRIRTDDVSYNGLDSSLKGKLNGPLEKIEERIEMLQDARQDETFVKAVNALQSTFDTLPDKVEHIISENVSNTMNDHAHVVDGFKAATKDEITKLRDSFLKERLEVAQTEFTKTISTFVKNAYNLGGLRNKTIREAINAIENRLKNVESGAEAIEDSDTLMSLKRQIIATQMAVITDALNPKCHDFEDLKMLQSKIGEPVVIFQKHEETLTTLVTHARQDLMNSLNCAHENAKNLGGLRNHVVEAGIKAIQEKLERGTDEIDTFDMLINLQSDPVQNQTKLIEAEVNPNGSSVKDALERTLKSIESPKDKFAIHQAALGAFTKASQDALDNVMEEVRTCIETHSVLNNTAVKRAIENIQRTMHSMDTEKIQSMTALQNLANEPVGSHIKQLTTALTVNSRPIVAPKLQGLTSTFKQPQDIFKNNHEKSLTSLANDTQQNLINAVENALKYVESAQSPLRRKIRSALDAVTSAFNIETKDSDQLKSKMEEELNKIKQVSDSFNSVDRLSVESKLNELNALKINAIKERLSPKNPKSVEKGELDSWLKNANSFLLNYVFDEAAETIHQADQAYRVAVNKQLQLIKQQTETLKDNATSHKLDGFLNTYERHFVGITKAITTNSVYEADKTARQQYFENLTKLINNTVSSLKSAYQKAYQISAQSYLSGAISTLKKELQAAETVYVQQVTSMCAQIQKEIGQIVTKAGKDELDSVLSGVDPLFNKINIAINNHSAFKDDIDVREKYFKSLKDVINNTVSSVKSAYQKAYTSSGKSYLSAAIRTITAAVEAAEAVYGDAVSAAMKNVRFEELKESGFRVNKTRDELSNTLTEPFTKLLQQVERNSAFKDDSDKRTDCFKKCQDLIKNRVATLSIAYKEAYQNSAQTYLLNAVCTIKEAVNTAEGKYADNILFEIQELKKQLTHVTHEKVTNKRQHSILKTALDAPYKLVQSTILQFSAFKTDLESRTKCFEKLKKLITDTVETLVIAANAFDKCSIKALGYLDTAMNDAKIKIGVLGSTIKDSVRQAFDKIIFEVYTMYSNDKIAHLRSLKMCIEEQLEQMKSIIEKDKVTGIKGLFKSINGMPLSIDPTGIFKFDASTSNNLLTKLNNDLPKLPAQNPAGQEYRTKFSDVSTKIRNYLDPIMFYIIEELNTTENASMKIEHISRYVHEMHIKLTELLAHFIHDKHILTNPNTARIYILDHIFVNKLENLKTQVNALSPTTFHRFHKPLLLNAIKSGMEYFTEQLGYAYVNKYEGSQPIEWHDDEAKEKVSEDGLKSARIFLTLIPEWDKHLPYLRRECIGGCSTKRISLIQTDNSKTPSYNALGDWFRHRGYVVSNFDKQEGELINNDKFKGTNIRQSLSKLFSKATIFNTLLYYLYEYYKLCHIKHIPGANPPTTISQMLHWLCGLEYTPMYENMKTYLQEWFNEFKKEHEFEKALPATVPKRTGHEVVTDFNLGNLLGSYQNVTLRASEVLLTILGYGDADGRYACEFYTNPYNLDYPTDKNKCFDMLVEICLRLNHQLRFLYMQCHNGPRSSGWADCRYGKHIAGSAWNCNRLQCVEQGCDQNCKRHNDCGVKSPLQSFLEDGLKGFLPHQFSSPSCKLECSVKNHNGIPCKTPMGFADISITASWTKTGSDIKKVLDPFCGTLPDSLSLLCAYFLCLLRRPPQTLCDMFAFYGNFFEHWRGHHDSVHKEHVKKHKHDAFYDAVAKANFGVEYDGLDPTTMFSSSSHSSDATTHLEGDLFAIVNCKQNENPVHPCGSYLQPLSYEVRCVFTEKLAADYLSWIVYITETFYALLNDLYNKCTKCCIQQQADCYGNICAKGCTVDSTTEASGTKPLQDKTHGELCNSIVQCAGIHPTIFAAGFTFGSPWNLSGDNGVEKKRSCKDFCTALGLVVKENHILYTLVHEKIPAFLWEIRHKFFYTLVALWAYSLLYLLYVIIGRLDTFHIRSHLRLPSSHKISAQSLLATARLNNLAKLAYLRT